jgi:hypothetical protein
MFFQDPSDKINMNTIKRTMIKKAKNRFKKILPCGRKRKFAECFTVEKDKVFFWFNTEDQSTHVLYSEF